MDDDQLSPMMEVEMEGLQIEDSDSDGETVSTD
jgi:hypothetical protein